MNRKQLERRFIAVLLMAFVLFLFYILMLAMIPADELWIVARSKWNWAEELIKTFALVTFSFALGTWATLKTLEKEEKQDA